MTVGFSLQPGQKGSPPLASLASEHGRPGQWNRLMVRLVRPPWEEPGRSPCGWKRQGPLSDGACPCLHGTG